MGFLKKLFGGRTPAERLAEAERLLAGQEPGLARHELEGALAAPELSAVDRERAEVLLRRARGELAAARFAEARTFLEADDIPGAGEALELGEGLAEGPELLAEAERLRQALGARSAAARQAARPAADEIATLDGEGADEGGDDDEGDEAAHAAEGDDEMSSLDLALLALPEEESERLRALAALDPALADALALAYEGDGQKATARFAQAREPAASDPLVLREWARAALHAGETAAALALLPRVLAALPEDVAAAELLVEAELASGSETAAAGAAAELLKRGLPRTDLDAFTQLLVGGGRGEEAVASVDLHLGKNASLPRLWELRGALCDRLGRKEEAAEADARAVACFQRAATSMPFPLTSARRLASALTGDDAAPSDLTRARPIVELLVRHDPEGSRRWRALFRRIAD